MEDKKALNQICTDVASKEIDVAHDRITKDWHFIVPDDKVTAAGILAGKIASHKFEECMATGNWTHPEVQSPNVPPKSQSTQKSPAKR